jgi:hypothetical protein
VTARPLTLAAVLSIAERMRESDRREIFALCWPGRDTPEALAMEVVRVTRFGATFHSADGEPQAALGLAPLWPGCFSAWMFATDRWSEVWRGAVRHALGPMREAAEAAGMWRAQCHSAADHYSGQRFLLALGFRREGPPVPYGKNRETFAPWARVTG